MTEQSEGTVDGGAAAAQAGALKKADLGKRIPAALIDGILAFVVGFIPFIGGLIGTAYWCVRDGLEIDFMDKRSIGKKVMKLRPVTLDGSPMDIMVSIKRNWMFALSGIAQVLAYTIIGLIIAIPLALVVFLLVILEVVLVITDDEGRRLGDKIANTMVIEVDD